MTCKIKKTMCNVVIDSDRCENTVSVEIVQKLELKMYSHYKPYKLT